MQKFIPHSRPIKLILTLLILVAIFGPSLYEIARYRLRLATEPILVSGTGSMYPTFPKGTGKTPKELSEEVVAQPGMLPYPSGFSLLGKRFFAHTISRKDIVVFRNQQTEKITLAAYGDASGLVKRVIGLPGDTIEIRDGILYLNSVPQLEPYTARARSTFGGDFLPDCQSLTIPQGKLFVIGDNRKGSADSRHELGLISYTDVHHVLPYENQIGKLDSLWRNPAHDLETSSKIKLDKSELLTFINSERAKTGAQPLRLEPKLNSSSAQRSNAILSSNDFSFTATQSGLTAKQAMSQSGYSNIIIGESIISGYYEASELIEYITASPEDMEFLLNPDFDDFGLAETEGVINGCPTQVIVQHFAGFVPPDYPPETVNSWRSHLDGLKKSLAVWENYRNNEDFYSQNQSTIEQIITLHQTRISRVEQVVAKMSQDQWLTTTEENYIKEDETLNNQINSLIQSISN